MSSVTLLFSDIEGSTRLLQRLGATYAIVLQEHHAILRHSFAIHRGDEQRTEGDSFFVLFDAPEQAVAAALDAQRALARHAWPEGIDVRVRMGVHTGEVSTIGVGLVGMAIHEAARIMSSAHGGQVLASSITASLAVPMPAGAAWVDVGEHRLKDLPTPLRLMQLTHPELLRDLPPPRSQVAGRTNLPAPTTSMVGRDVEAAEVRELVRENRLVTLTGSGGAGKTRLAERVGAELVEQFGDGAWFVELAPVTDAAGVGTALASAVGAVGQSTVEGVASMIGTSRALVIVDNCEHLVDDAGRVVQVLLQSCPNLAVLATSREPLGVAGEVSWRVPSLSAEESLTLFVERATAADPRVQFDEAKHSRALEICERLDGIPLAIELAAARLQSLGIEQLADRLDKRFRLLTGGRRGGLARQRTLQAAVDWSYDLLEPDAQRLLRWLGAFVGGFLLEGAECAGRAAGLEEFDVLDNLDALVQKSLVLNEERDGVNRYRLLETIRQYALDRLLDEDELVNARNAHLAWVYQWCVARSAESWGQVPSAAVYDVLEVEHDNVRGALDWAIEQRDVDSATTITVAVALFWAFRGFALEGMRRALVVVEMDQRSTGLQLALLYGAWVCAGNATEELDERTVERLDTLANSVPESDPWAFVSPSTLSQRALRAELDNTERVALVRAQLDRARTMGNPVGVGFALQAMTTAYQWNGDFDEARRTVREFRRHMEETGLMFAIVRSLGNALNIEMAAGDVEAAWDIGNSALAAAREHKDRGMVGVFLYILSGLAFRRDDLGSAAALAVEALDEVRRTRGQVMAASCENQIAWIAAVSGDAGDAHIYAEAALERWRALDNRSSMPGLLHTAGEAARLAGRSDLAVGRHLEGLDIAIDGGDRSVAAAVLLGLAAVAASRGNGDIGCTLLGASDEHRPPEGQPPADDRFFAAIEREVLHTGGDRADELRSAGRELSLEDARALARMLR
jgi:predicted ATPase/class 3 adenylate cyclase